MKSGPTLPGTEDTSSEPRSLPYGCQLEHQFTDAEWESFVQCARDTWNRGEFIHNEFEAKRREKHKHVSDADIRNALNRDAGLVAYQDRGMERVSLYDRDRSGVVIVATLQDGMLTTFITDDFEGQTRRTKTDIRWLRRLP